MLTIPLDHPLAPSAEHWPLVHTAAVLDSPPAASPDVRPVAVQDCHLETATKATKHRPALPMNQAGRMEVEIAVHLPEVRPAMTGISHTLSPLLQDLRNAAVLDIHPDVAPDIHPVVEVLQPAVQVPQSAKPVLRMLLQLVGTARVSFLPDQFLAGLHGRVLASKVKSSRRALAVEDATDWQ